MPPKPPISGLGNQQADASRFESIGSDADEPQLNGRAVRNLDAGQHLEIANPADRGVARPPALSPQERRALKPLKNRQVERSTGRGAIGASVATAGAVAIGGGVLLAAGKGALIGAALGSVVPGVGTVVGAVIGGLVLGLGAALLGGGIGAAHGAYKGSKLSPETLEKKYAPGGKRFAKLARQAGVDPEALTKNDRARIVKNFGDVLRGRMKLGQPVTKGFLESTLASLIKLHAAPDSSEKQMEAIDQGMANIIDARVNGRRGIDAHFVNRAGQLLARGEESLGAVDRTGLGHADRQRIRTSFRAILQDRIAQGQPVDDQAMDAIRDGLLAISSSRELSESNKALLTASLQRSLSDADNTAITKELARAVTGGLLAIGTAPGLSDERRAKAIDGLRGSLQLRREMLRPIDAEFVASKTEPLIDVERILTEFAQESPLNDDDRKPIEDAFRRFAQGRMLTGQDVSTGSLEKGLASLAAQMSTPLPTSDREVGLLKAQSSQAADHVLDTLLNPYATEHEIMQALHQGLATSRIHTAARAEAGLNDDGSENLRSNGQRRIGGALGNDDYFAAFSDRLRESIADRDLSPQEAKLAYQRLMGPNGKARTLFFAGGMMNNDPRVTNQDPQQVYFAANALVGSGLQIALSDLGERGGFSKQKVANDFLQITNVTTQAFDAGAKEKALVESKMPLDVTGYNERKAARLRVRNALAGTPAYNKAVNYRLDLNVRNVDPDAMKAASISDDAALHDARAAVLDTTPAMEITIAAVDHAMDKSSQNRELAANQNQVGNRPRQQSDVSEVELEDA